jgi:hypothetical protein
MSEATAKVDRASVMGKMGTSSLPELIDAARRLGVNGEARPSADKPRGGWTKPKYRRAAIW